MKKQGIPKLETVREEIETELNALKKLELVKNNVSDELNSGSSMQQVAEKYQLSLRDSLKLSFGVENFQTREIEGVALGKIFSLPVNKPAAVAGKTNIYAVSVYEYIDASEPSPNFALEKSTLKNVVAGRNRTDNTILEGLKDRANVLDQRHLYFSR